MQNKINVISFGEKIDLASMISRHIMWPCLMYRINISTPLHQDLNALELLILRLAYQKIIDVEKIQNVCCLDKDLIRFIQDRLTQLGLLKKREITSEGEKQLGELHKDKASHSVIRAYVYVDKVTGKALPCVTKELAYEKINFGDNGSLSLSIGNAGEKKEIRLHKLNFKQDKSLQLPSPSIEDIHAAFEKMRKDVRRQQSLTSNKQDARLNIPGLFGLEIDKDPEEIYLHTQVFLPPNQDKFIVTNGFGTGFSESFSLSLEQLEVSWLSKLKENALKTKPLDKKRAANLIDLSIKTQNPTLGKFLELAEAGYHTYVLSSNTAQKELKTAVFNFYSALEHAFSFCWQQFNLEGWSNYIQASGNKELQAFIKVLCFQQFSIQGDKLFGKLSFNLLNRAASLVPEAQTLEALLALNLLSAKQSHEHLLHQLKASFPNLINELSELKSLRDAASHGEEIVLSKADLKEWRTKIYHYLVILQPKLKDYLPQESVADFILPDTNQEKLKAFIEFEKNFDLFTRGKFSTELKSQVILIEQLYPEMDNQTDKKYDASRWVLEIATLLQQVIYQQISAENYKQTETDLIKLAQIKLLQAGFLLENNQLPKSLATVRLGRIESACLGIETTLGATLLAFAINAAPINLKTLAIDNPNLILFIDRLLLLRGHGNQECLLFPNEIDEIKQASYQLIRLFLNS